MRENRILIAAVFLLLVAGFVSARSAGITQSQPAKPQIVKLSFDEKGYVVTPPSVTKGVPVKMEVDLGTVKGCMRTVVISAFDVKKTVKEGDTTIEFTPTRSGDIQIVCGMNMGKGTIIVVEPR
jgi:plastocyanin domain-containing protein